MKPTENYEQLLERFTKRIKQISTQKPANTVEGEKIKEQLDYLRDNKKNLSPQQIDILQGRDLKSNEGMIYGQMYNDWKNQIGFKLK